jgi:hypothetical protein
MSRPFYCICELCGGRGTTGFIRTPIRQLELRSEVLSSFVYAFAAAKSFSRIAMSLCEA